VRDNEGYEIQHDSIARSFRDTKEAAYAAAIFAKQRCPGEIIYLIDRATGTKMQVLPDGRLA
jgi:hypothetical protein